MFVYDVNDPASFHSLPEWIAECSKHSVTASNDTPHILIGNKCDLKTERRVRTDYAQVITNASFNTNALHFNNLFAYILFTMSTVSALLILDIC